MTNPLQLLERDDKHYLGSGQGMIFAPRFPRWLHRPGFWDEVDVLHYQLAPLFTVTFLSLEDGIPGKQLAARQLGRLWTPAELVGDYQLAEGLKGREHRSVLPGGLYVSEWSLDNNTQRPWTLLAVVWTVQDAQDVDLSGVGVAPGSCVFTRKLRDRRGEALAVRVSLDAPGSGGGAGAYLAEPAALDPDWDFTPFPEKWRNGVTTVVQVDGISTRGLLYLAASGAVRVPAEGAVFVRLQAQVEPEAKLEPRMTAPLAGHIRRHAPPREPTVAEPPPVEGEPGAVSRAGWAAYFEGCPQLECSDPYIERYWYYRWYGLRLCSHEGGIGQHVYPGCCEGTGYFHVPIAYSAQCHARELRWLTDPARARGVLLNFMAHQKQTGQFQGRIYVNHLRGTDFYFADWGEVALAIDAVHPEPGFLRAVYRPLALYADWLERERDADRTGLTDVIDHYETGQEYMSRYMAVSPEADSETWGNEIRLKGVDATVYTYRLQRALAKIADRLGYSGEAAQWEDAANRTGVAIRRIMWDAEAEMFFDVDPERMERTGAKAAVGFYPYLSDLTGPEHVAGLRHHLLNAAEFWTAFPVPATSADDPLYSPDAEWKGKRHNCPWNGRVWPMTNSHVAEALARAAVELDSSLRPAAAELIQRFIRMLFHDGDAGRPNCYEHYNPDTGRPSLYRGFDDYQHSWVNDLIVRYVAGFRPRVGDGFAVDPLPFGLDRLRLHRLPFRGRSVEIALEGEEFRVRVNGEERGGSRLGEPLEITSV